MLPTFVIGLREGVEAALIVGIIAAFLVKDPRGRGAMKWMWIGVAAAIVLCVAAGVALELVNEDLPQKEQEGLETIIALLAVGAVTFRARRTPRARASAPCSASSARSRSASRSIAAA
jgi:high-affinity iron transporter